MLRYRTMAPKKFTVNPIDKRKENEKNMQNQIKEMDLTPLVRQNRNNRNKSSNKAVSVAAAIERICFTSPGCGRSVVEANACGVLTKKLPTDGLSSGGSIPEFPCNVLNAFCFSTTAWGKSNAGKT